MDPTKRRLVKYILWELAIFLVLVLIITCLSIYFEFGEVQRIVEFLPKVIVAILIILIAKLSLSVIKPAFDKIFEKRLPTHADVKMTWQFIANMVWIFVIVFLILIMIGDFTGWVTFGVIVAALLWVLQKPILNMAGWMDIIFHKPYAIGDRIEIDGKIGYVVDVGMFHTIIREIGGWMKGDTFTGRLISIPNSTVFEKPIVNYTRDTPYIWDEIKIAITYESDHDLAKQHILSGAVDIVGDDMIKYSMLMAQKIEIRDLYRELIKAPIVMTEFSDSCVNYYVIYLCEAGQRRAIKSKITERILDKIKRDNMVRIAYPHMEVVGVGKK